MPEVDYPDKFARGIPNDSYLEDGLPASHLFYFEANASCEPRDDRCNEVSVNWCDDDGAVEQLLRQAKADGTLQFKAGAVLLSKEKLDYLMHTPLVSNRLSYERRAIPGNSYHGNLLLTSDTPKSLMKRIAASIATMCVEPTIRRPG